jgi:hypothetical protein
LLRNFREPYVVPPPLIYNEHPQVAEMLASLGPEAAEQRVSAGFNELIDAIVTDREAAASMDRQLAALAGVGTGTSRLWLAFGLLILGTILGGVANITSAAGTGAERIACELRGAASPASPTTVYVTCN